MNRLGQWWRRNKEEMMIALIGLIITIIVVISVIILVYFGHKANKEDYYSYSTVIINNIEYKTEDTDFICADHRHLTIELKDGTRIETSDYILKK
jgi:hypothetical protein